MKTGRSQKPRIFLFLFSKAGKLKKSMARVPYINYFLTYSSLLKPNHKILALGRSCMRFMMNLDILAPFKFAMLEIPLK